MAKSHINIIWHSFCRYRYMTNEIFKPIEGYENLYEISNLGNLKTLKTGKITNGWEHCKYGHRKVRLYKNNIAKDFYLHRLVAYAFIPQIENKIYVNHIDSNPNNNCASNLEWCTQKENMTHAKMKGRMKNKNTKLVLNTKTGIYYNSINEAAASKNIKPNTLTCQFKRKSKIDFILVDSNMKNNAK